MRVVKEPRGIICHGVVTEGAEEDEHWRPQYAGEKCWYIWFVAEGSWDPEDPAISLQRLKNDSRFSGIVGRRQSGTFIRDDIADALLNLEEWKNEGLAFAEEILPNRKHTEGAQRVVYVNARERNRHARLDCIAHHGAKCAVCGLVFAEKYGPKAKGLIHVHHLTPLQNIDKQYQVNPVEDLRPVCPNCHAVIHYKQGDSPREIDEVKEMLRRK